MAKRTAAASGEMVNISRAKYDAMTNTMLELAYRGEMQEALMMRAAKAGGIDEVTKEISRRRMYAKKQGMVRSSRVDHEPRTAPKKKATRKKKAGPQPVAAEVNSGAGDTTTHHV